jgi:hypothetical protein
MKFNLHFNLFNIIVIIFMIYVIFRLPSIEQMSNIDKATEDKIREIYKIDTDAIRNLSNLAKDLTVGGKLTVPGGLEIKGDLKVDGNSEVLKQTTIHELYGGKSTWGGWRDIIVNGGHLMFNVGNKGYGFHSNDNALHYKVNNEWKPLHIFGGVATNEDIHMKNGKTIRSDGRLHIHPQERLYLLAKGNTYITADWGGDGNVTVNRIGVNNGVVVGNGDANTVRPWGDRGLHIRNQNGTWTHFNWLKTAKEMDVTNHIRGITLLDGGGNIVRNGEMITIRSHRTGRRLQDRNKNAQFENHNRGHWEQMFIEKF